MTRKRVSGEPKKVGRPSKLNPDEETLALLRELGEIACTGREAAGFLKVAESTFDAFLARSPQAHAAWHGGQDGSKASLRRKLFKLADTNAAAAIFLAKNLLGMKDGSTVAVELPVGHMTDEQLDALRTAISPATASGESSGRDRAPPTAH